VHSLPEKNLDQLLDVVYNKKVLEIVKLEGLRRSRTIKTINGLEIKRNPVWTIQPKQGIFIFPVRITSGLFLE